jgi:hypothetical protein
MQHHVRFERTPEQIAASNEAMRLRRIGELKKLQREVEYAIKWLERGKSPHLDDDAERDLLDAAYDVFQAEELHDQARQYGPCPEAL